MHFGSLPASLRCSCVVLLVLGAVGLTTLPARAQDAKDSSLPTIAEKTEGMTKMDGYVPVYWDAATGKLWLEISRFDTEMLYVSSLPTGLGSNPVGLDRGQLGTQRVVRFERTGPTVLLVTPNLDYRAASDNAYERTAVREAFAPRALTLRVRHSLVELPDTTGYTPRRFDPRSGLFYTDYMDFATPIGKSMTKRLVNRHRLTCAEAPGADGLCPPEEPIVYYLDPGTPEPVRSALLDGARWWAEAFEAAGFEDAYRVEVLPDSADAMDVRYNVIQWVHRRTRGWSYGASVTDPRTGEILKGHVTLGSQRVRQDYLLAEGLLAPYQGARADGFPPGDDPMLEMALARIRQLSAHEVGHTLGLAHNFAASVNDRASVMDYPAPLARVEGDSISLREAYDTGVERWDVKALQYAYARPGPNQTEAALLDSLVRAAEREGLRYVTDADARPAGAAHPKGNLWDNGRNMVDALDREMRVRDVALDRFGEAVVKRGEPLAHMEEALVPLYLRHWYQVGATAKLIGGEVYEYAVRGESEAQVSERVPAQRQAAALDALLSTITPAALALPEAARTRIPPRPPGHPDTREVFEGRTDPTFDPYAPAEVAATLVLDALTAPERALRLIEQRDATPDLPGLQGTLTTITEAVWKADPPADGYRAEVQRTVQQVWTDVLLDRADAGAGAPAVRARLEQHLRTLRDWLAAHPGASTEAEAHRTAVRASIDRYFDRSHDAASPPASVAAPPGSPIGQAPGYHRRHAQRQAWLDRWTPPVCSRQRP